MILVCRDFIPGVLTAGFLFVISPVIFHFFLTMDSERKFLLGLSAVRENRLEIAEKEFRNSLLERRIDPLLKSELAESSHNLGCVTKNLQEREVLLTQALAIRQNIGGFEKSITELCLANHFFSVGEFRKCEPLYLSALETAKLASGKTRGYILPYSSALIDFYLKTGNIEKAEKLKREQKEVEAEVISYFNR
ncbi:MAG: hypothetical protein J0M35_12315 [Candidatus Obscuribacter phosphatis]|uniref:Tetratricopeptide repeat protein n=1 Tax=Candidatus Obscuribacter phosphatis TaxID=1906157 RepID=A0A8J7PN94_9BACT|nr:hypothetical protein [Candidatus Obscuribacter phosphatis]